jgi:L-fuconolactonase
MTGRVDSHCHLWRLDRGDYGWLDAANPKLAPIARDFDLADLAAVCDPAGLSQVVAVQAAPTVAETRYLLDLAASSPRIAGVVGWVDLSCNEAVRDIETFGQSAAFKGVRPMLQDIADAAWITTAPRPEAIAALVHAGLRFDALVLPQHLEPLLQFAQNNPSLPIVIDHAAKPVLAAPSDDPRHAMWREGMQKLAANTNVCCKISGLLTELSPAQCRDPMPALQPVVDDLLAWFGPSRLMWGSDWPVLTLAAPHQDWLRLSDQLLAGLTPQGRHQIYTTTAQMFYGLGAAA